MMITENDLTRRLHSARDAAMSASPVTVTDAPVVVAESASPATPRRARRRFAVAVVGAGLAAAAVTAGVVVAANAGPTTSGVTQVGAATEQPAAAYTHVVESNATGVEQEFWIPADTVHGTWMLHVPATSSYPEVRETAVCAAFPYFRLSSVGGDAPFPGCDTSGGWDLYRPPFAATISDDPAAVVASLRDDSGRSRSDAEVFVAGEGFATDGMAPPAAVSKVLAALRTLPGTTVTHGVANAAGVRGDAISYTGQVKPGVTQTWTVIVDPASGEVIGSADSWSGNAPYLTAITRTAVAGIGATS